MEAALAVGFRARGVEIGAEAHCGARADVAMHRAEIGEQRAPASPAGRDEIDRREGQVPAPFRTVDAIVELAAAPGRMDLDPAGHRHDFVAHESQSGHDRGPLRARGQRECRQVAAGRVVRIGAQQLPGRDDAGDALAFEEPLESRERQGALVGVLAPYGEQPGIERSSRMRIDFARATPNIPRQRCHRQGQQARGSE